MKKSDLFTMVYQFFVASVIFFFVVMEELSKDLTGKIIYSLESLGIYLGFLRGNLIFPVMVLVGVFGLVVQRKIYLRRQIKKAIEPYKRRIEEK